MSTDWIGWHELLLPINRIISIWCKKQKCNFKNNFKLQLIIYGSKTVEEIRNYTGESIFCTGGMSLVTNTFILETVPSLKVKLL